MAMLKSQHGSTQANNVYELGRGIVHKVCVCVIAYYIVYSDWAQTAVTGSRNETVTDRVHLVCVGSARLHYTRLCTTRLLS
jgi:hypothetical protein